MIKSVSRASASLFALGLFAAGAQAQAPQGNAASAEPDSPETGDIVVTASKREQKVRDVPSAITLLSGEDLANQGVQSIRDYATLTPGLAQRDYGYAGYGTIFIRGLTTGAGQQSATSVFYLDDVAFTSSSPLNGSAFLAPEPELADIDRIEVLKGPQSTLYGASSLGGVIRMISKRPDPGAFSGKARGEMTAIDGGGVGYSVRASANVPLVADRLAVRATAFYRRAPGFVDNAGTGTENVNRSTTKGARLALGWTPTERLTIDLVGQMQNIDARGPARQHTVSGTLTPLIGKRQYNDFFDAPTRVRYRLASLTGSYDLGPGRLIATASYLESKFYTETDATPIYVPYLPLLGLPATTGVAITNGIPLKKKTAELRFVSNRLGPIEFILGGFVTEEHVLSPTTTVARDRVTNGALPAPFGELFVVDVEDDYREAAIFGNATFYLTDRLDITGGLRFAHSKEDNLITYGGLLQGGQTVELPLNDSSDATSYLATLRWRPTDTVSTFLRAASGYRPGGPQTTPNPPPGAQTRVRPDTVWNYEAGIKADLLDRRLSLSASLYRIDWNDVQLNTIFSGFQVLANGGKARVDGFEVEAVARPTRQTTIAASLGYTDARIVSIDPGAATTIGAAAGDPLPLTPRWSAAAVLDQAIPLGDELDGQLGATLRYQSHMFNAYPGSLQDVNLRLPSITTLDVRAGLRFQRYQLQFRVENMFDRNGVTNIATPAIGAPSLATVTRPRSFTVSLSADF
jgi:outer membrane receptor protein involved in Fe transport